MNKNQHPLYVTWQRMRSRCHNPNHDAYPYYGGRGIKVCSRWDEFWNFVEDMGDRPTGFWLDRINTNGNYEPSNCRWSDQPRQQRNKRAYGSVKHKWVTLRGNRYRATWRNPETKRLISCGQYDTAEEAHLAACAHRLENYWRI